MGHAPAHAAAKSGERSASRPAAAGPAPDLAQTAGNQAIQALLRGGWVRPKLELGAPDDPEEREADAVAARVMRMPEGAGDDMVRRKPERASTPGVPMPHAAEHRVRSLTSGGEALSPSLRAFFEPRMGRDLGSVRIHRDGEAQGAASAIQARAFTLGQHIGFAAGRWAPDSEAGRRLLAHELAHTGQAGGTARTVRRDIEADFAGRATTPVIDAPTRPPGTIRATDAAGASVYAPYGIYRLGDIPARYDGLTMEAGIAFQIRNPGLSLAEQLQRSLGDPNANRMSIGQMRTFFAAGPANQEIRVMLAQVNGQMRLVGYDSASFGSSMVGQGYVESEVGTGAVGRMLFADRITRTLGQGVPGMNLTVGNSDRTSRFHAEVFRAAGRDGAPMQGDHYTLSTREMVRVALAWSDALTPAQRLQLAGLAAGSEAPTPAAVQSALAGRTAATPGQGRAPGSGTAPEINVPVSGETMELMRRFLGELRSQVRRPAEIENLRRLQEAETQARVMREHGGLATVGSQLYRLEAAGSAIRISEVSPVPISQRVPTAGTVAPAQAPGRTPLAPEAPSVSPPLINLDPLRWLNVGGTYIPPSIVRRSELREGEFLIVGYDNVVEARDPATGRPLAGIYEGGRWYRIVGADQKTLEFDPASGMPIVTLRMAGAPVRAVEMPKEPDLPTRTAWQRAPGSTAAVGVGGIIMVVNEILGPIGAALENQRAWIRSGQAEIDLWIMLGANPKAGVWDRWGQGPAPAGTSPDTAVFGTWYYPYVADIDGARLSTELPRRIGSYVELQGVLDSLRTLGALREKDGRTVAVVNRPQRDLRLEYDITEAVRTVQALTLAAEDERLRERLAARPASERVGRIFRIRRGAMLHRSQGGMLKGQPLHGAGDQLGGNALVREIRRTDYTFSTDKVFVEPVNVDAYQAVARATYWVPRPIEEVWQECKDGGREVEPAKLPSFGDGPLRSFRAGPETGREQRFGWTSYQQHPEMPYTATMATGEVRAFWVSVDDITRIDDAEIEQNLRR